MKAWVIAVGLSLLASSVASEPVAPVAAGASPVAAQGASAAATPAAAAAVVKPVKPPKPPKPPRPKLICEETKVLGSMMPTQVCATQAEWDARRREDTSEIDRFHDRSGSTGGGGP